MTPREFGYRPPAEWETHTATFLSWPNITGDTFYDSVLLDPALESFKRVVEAIVSYEKVILTVSSKEEKKEADAAFSSIDPGMLEVIHIPTREPWCRDVAPTFLVSEKEHSLGAVRWRFNGWGEKCVPFDLDLSAGPKFAEHVSAQLFEPDIIFEGGGLESNGRGKILTTEGCILNSNRNPGLTKQVAEQLLIEFLGADEILWMPDTVVVGDDTDGHIDVVTRFFDENSVLTAVPAKKNTNHSADLIRNCKLLEKSGLTTVEIPIPEPIWDDYQKLWIPPSYANFYVGNGFVLLPVFDVPEDGPAQAILESCFPGRDVIPIPSIPIIAGLGGIHCLTQQVPEIPS